MSGGAEIVESIIYPFLMETLKSFRAAHQASQYTPSPSSLCSSTAEIHTRVLLNITYSSGGNWSVPARKCSEISPLLSTAWSFGAHLF